MPLVGLFARRKAVATPSGIQQRSTAGSGDAAESSIKSGASSSVRTAVVNPPAVDVALARKAVDGSPAPLSPTADTR